MNTSAQIFITLIWLILCMHAWHTYRLIIENWCLFILYCLLICWYFSAAALFYYFPVSEVHWWVTKYRPQIKSKLMSNQLTINQMILSSQAYVWEFVFSVSPWLHSDDRLIALRLLSCLFFHLCPNMNLL
jgi:hypothetical protein